jgi:hypothetical protein
VHVPHVHHDKAQGHLDDAPIAVCDLHLAAHAWAMPTARRFVLRPPRLLQHEGQCGLLLAPGFECLADGTRPRNSGDDIDLVLET